MTIHDNFLLYIGMVTSVSKTELIFFSWNKLEYKHTLTVKDKDIKQADSMKVLGLKFEPELGWDQHIRSTIPKVKLTLKKLKFIARFIKEKDLLKVGDLSHLWTTILWISCLACWNDKVCPLKDAEFHTLLSCQIGSWWSIEHGLQAWNWQN